ncbi:MAG: TolC family protein, partial [Frateuria sp.]|nr:TolC family protein [Frateuria sp.]
MRLTAAASAALVLAGCASFSPDGGAGKVSELTKERTGQGITLQRSAADVDSALARVGELLKQPLMPESAVEIALLNNRGLQASFSELGIAEADRVRAGRLANPTLSFGRLAGGGVTEIDRSVMFNILGLLTLPVASQVAQRQLEQAQFQAAFDAVGVAADARKAFFGAVAAQDLVRYYEQVKEAADASNELARRMLQAGNFNKLAQMREQQFHADATANLARARHQSVAERERLVRVLGLSGEQLAFKLPERLPDLPTQPIEPKDAEQTAIDKRLDVLIAKRSVDATAKSLGLTKATRFINVLEVGYANKSQTGEPRQNGYEIELELPLFDFGSTRAARAEATYMQALHRTAEVAVNARSEVRESYSAYRTAYDL